MKVLFEFHFLMGTQYVLKIILILPFPKIPVVIKILGFLSSFRLLYKRKNFMQCLLFALQRTYTLLF